MKCMIIQKEKVEDGKVSYLVKYNSNKFILNIYSDSYASEENKVNICEFLNYVYGDVLEIRGKITIPETMNNPYEFNYKRYLNSNNIVATITTYKVQCVDKISGNIFVKFGYYLRENINKIIDEKMPVKEAGLFKSMIYGNDLELSKDISMSFNENGISHMLAVSGMHIMYIIKILNIVTKDMKKEISILLNILVIFSFCIISSMSISVIRASIMAVISIIDFNKSKESDNQNNEFYNKTKNNSNFFKYKKLFIAFVILLINNPYSIFNLSFQMSFLATVGIITYNSLVYSYFTVVFKIKEKYKYMIDILSLSISANILILPLQIYYFGKIELISFISNILLSPIITFEFFIGFISIFLAFVPVISDIVVSSNIVVLKVIIYLISILQKINYFTVYIPRLNYLEIFCTYLTIFFQTNKKYIPVIVKRKYKVIARKMILFVTLFTILYSISMYVYRIYFEEYVYFFNVGQGNMALVRNNRKIVIFDLGSTNKTIASNVLENFLKAKAIYTIDMICITHMHDDHVNGIYEISEKFKIKKIVYSIPKTTEKGEYERLSNLLEKRNISKIEVNKNDDIQIDDIKIQVLMPYYDKTIISNDMLNSNSTVYLLEIKIADNESKKILFMGDATKETEKIILNDADKLLKEKLRLLDVIQIGHHGSKTSSSEEFLREINPCLAIISSKKEKYGHPHKSTIEKLEKYNFDIKITQECGAIKVK